MRVGFIGLGHMGLPMAQRLAASEFPLTAWNRTSSRAAPLAATGTRLAGSPSALAAGCDVVITSQPSAVTTSSSSIRAADQPSLAGQ